MNIKLFNRYFMLTAMGLVLFTASCRKEEKPIGDPFSRTDGIKGAWKLTQVLQVDEASPVKEFRDLSEYYINPDGSNLMEISFDASNKSVEVTPGKGKNFFGTTTAANSRWSFYNSLNPGFSETAPDYVQIINDQNDTLALKLLNPVREHDQTLGLQLVRCKLSYKFYFTRK